MKKLISTICFLTLLICLSFSTACNIILFDVNFIVDGEIYHTIETDGKSTITMPKDPVKEGFEFDGWYWDNEVWNQPFTINSFLDAKLSESLNVYAKFVEEGAKPVATQGLVFTLQTATNSYALSGYTGVDTTVNIPSTYLNCSVTAISPSAFENNYSIKEVNIPDSVVVIGADAFSECFALEKVSISKNLQILGGGAFSNCIKLESITIPSTLTTVGDNAFNNCDSLEEITVPGDKKLITYFGNDESLLPSSLKTLKISENTKNICDGFAHSIQSIENLYIPKKVESIGAESFTFMESLKNIYFDAKNCTTTEGNMIQVFHANSNCKKITLTIGKNVESLANELFHLSFVEKVIFEENSSLKTIGDLTFAATAITEITLPNTIETIGASAFSANAFAEFVLPETLTYLGAYCFADCINLTNINIPNGITVIEDGLFSQCYSLTNVTIPENATFIGTESFAGTGIVEIVIPDKVENIAPWAFAGAKSLFKITLGKNLQTIDSCAFTNCSLSLIYNLSKINIEAFSDNAGEIALYTSNIFTSLDDEINIEVDENGYMFVLIDQTYLLLGKNYAKNEDALNLPNGYKGKDYIIKNNAFNNASIKTIVINGGINKIEANAFGGQMLDSLQTIEVFNSSIDLLHDLTNIIKDRSITLLFNGEEITY